MYEQNDIILIPFPYSDLTGSKQRPALIVSNGRINKTEDRICCLITSQQPDEGIAIDKNNLKNGTLPFKSWTKPHRLFTVNEKIIVKKLCTVTDDFHEVVVNRINEFLKAEL